MVRSRTPWRTTRRLCGTTLAGHAAGRGAPQRRPRNDLGRRRGRTRHAWGAVRPTHAPHCRRWRSCPTARRSRPSTERCPRNPGTSRRSRPAVGPGWRARPRPARRLGRRHRARPAGGRTVGVPLDAPTRRVRAVASGTLCPPRGSGGGRSGTPARCTPRCSRPRPAGPHDRLRARTSTPCSPPSSPTRSRSSGLHLTRSRRRTSPSSMDAAIPNGRALEVVRAAAGELAEEVLPVRRVPLGSPRRGLEVPRLRTAPPLPRTAPSRPRRSQTCGRGSSRRRGSELGARLR
jgi:hypothetical protein